MTFTKSQNEQIERIAINLHITRAEAEQVFLDDLEIDKMKSGWNDDLSAEQKKVSAEMRRTTNANLKGKTTKAVNAYGKEVKRERKADNEKAEIMEIISNALADKITDLTVVNAEREITFLYKGRKMKITLALPRS